MLRTDLMILFGAALVASAQTPPSEPQDTKPSLGDKVRQPSATLAQAGTKTFTIEPGTKILLSMINSVSTKHAAEGDRVYLETAFPILINGKIVIPPGSYVAGTVTDVRRPGRVKGRAELYVGLD